MSAADVVDLFQGTEIIKEYIRSPIPIIARSIKYTSADRAPDLAERRHVCGEPALVDSWVGISHMIRFSDLYVK